MKKLKIVLVFLILMLVVNFSYANMEKNQLLNNNEQEIVAVSSTEVNPNTEFYIILNLSKIEYNKFKVKIVNASNTTVEEIPQEVKNVSSNNREISFTVDKETISLDKLAVVYMSPTEVENIEFNITITSLDEDLESLKLQLETIKTEIKNLEEKLEELKLSQNTSNVNTSNNTITSNVVSNNTVNSEVDNEIAVIEKKIVEKNKEKSELEEKISNYTQKSISKNVSIEIVENKNEFDENKKMLGQEDREKNNMITDMKKMMSEVQELKGNLKTANDTISSLTESSTYQGSQNNYLSNLSLTGVEFKNSFKKTTHTYFATVDSSVEKVVVNATAEDSSAIVTIYGNDNLKTGKNKILITVTADDGSTRTYKIYLTKQ